MSERTMLERRDTTPFERDLLAAGRRRVAPEAARRRALIATGASVVAIGTAATSSSTALVAGKGAAALALLWKAAVVAAVVVSVALTLGALPPVALSPAPPVARAATAERAVIPVPSPLEHGDVLGPVAAPHPLPSPPPAMPVVARASLAVEITEIERARAALHRGDAAGALTMLERFAKAHPRSSLDQEAGVLQIEAMIAADEQDGAVDFAAAFLHAHPSSPYARRIHSLLEHAP